MASERWGITHRVAPSGELDLATSPLLERELIRVERTGVSMIELDLGGLTFMDSAGVGVLARAEARAQLSGFALIVKPGGRAVQRVLALLGADESLSTLMEADESLPSTDPAGSAHRRARPRRSHDAVGVAAPDRSGEPVGDSGFATDWTR